MWEHRDGYGHGPPRLADDGRLGRRRCVDRAGSGARPVGSDLCGGPHAPPAPRSTPNGEPESGASRILDERFARGEIDEDEYRRRCSALLEAHHGPTCDGQSI